MSLGVSLDTHLPKALIGDTHGSLQQLIDMLKLLGIYKVNGKWVNDFKYFVIHLGDLNDYRHHEGVGNSYGCLKVMMELWQLGWAETLDSNHQHKLKRVLKKETVKLSNALLLTVGELKFLPDVDRGSLADWLSERPLWVLFEEGELKYAAAHAYWCDWMTNSLAIKDVKSLCRYGPKDDKGRRVEWWRGKGGLDLQTRITVVGHYHTHGDFGQAVLVDGGCGDGGELLAYLPSTHTFLSVPFTLSGENHV